MLKEGETFEGREFEIFMKGIEDGARYVASLFVGEVEEEKIVDETLDAFLDSASEDSEESESDCYCGTCGYEKGYKAGYSDCQREMLDFEVSIDTTFLDYINEIRSLVMDLRTHTDEEKFNFYLYDISNKLTELTEWSVMQEVYKYWGYK